MTIFPAFGHFGKSRGWPLGVVGKAAFLSDGCGSECKRLLSVLLLAVFCLVGNGLLASFQPPFASLLAAFGRDFRCVNGCPQNERAPNGLIVRRMVSREFSALFCSAAPRFLRIGRISRRDSLNSKIFSRLFLACPAGV